MINLNEIEPIVEHVFPKISLVEITVKQTEKSTLTHTCVHDNYLYTIVICTVCRVQDIVHRKLLADIYQNQAIIFQIQFQIMRYSMHNKQNSKMRNTTKQSNDIIQVITYQ